MSLTNFVQLRLQSGITAVATSMTVFSPAGPFRLPDSSGTLVLTDSLTQPSKAEIVTYTGLVNNGNGTHSFTGLGRGAEGTTAQVWSAQANVVESVTAGVLSTLLAAKLDVGATAAAATRLATPRTINGATFDGSADITVEDDTKLPLSGGTLTDVLRFFPGTVSAPGLCFSNDADTGFYRIGTNALGVSTGGTLAASFLSDGSMDVYGRLRSIGNTATPSWTSRGCSFATEPATHTDTSSVANATVSTRAANSFGAPTFASTNPIAVTTAINVYVNGVPVAGANTTITDAWAVWVNGRSRVNGELVANSFSGEGSALTALDASNLATGTVHENRLSDSGVQYPSLVNSFTVSGLTTAQRVKYRKVGKVVTISGLVARSTNSGFGMAVFTLPAGYRPYGNVSAICHGSTSDPFSVSQKLVQITPDGVVSMVWDVIASPIASTSVSWDMNITFLVP